MNLLSVPTYQTITPEEFKAKFYDPRKPVIIKGISRQWPAFEKWTPEYFKKMCGDKIVGLYNNLKADPSTPVNMVDEEMEFGKYMDLISTQPTQLRIFLFNAFKNIPGLLNDFTYPEDLMPGFLKRFPMLFFGGAGSIVHMHFDMDMSNIMLTQFHGRKKVILFAPEETPKLYNLPFTVQSYIDPENPDYQKHPALHHVTGYECEMEHGDTLFIPTGYWHYMNYLEGGYALALRAVDTSLTTKLQGAYNLFVMRNIDDFLKKHLTKPWFNYKNRTAYERANKFVDPAYQTEPEQISEVA